MQLKRFILSAAKWVIRGLVMALCLFIAYTSYSFLKQYLYYHRMTLSENVQIGLKPSKDEAIVVLAGDLGRIPQAVKLLRERQSPLLIISGAGKKVSKTALLNRQGDSAFRINETWEKIVVESASESTIENAKESAKILSNRKFGNVVLVTSEYHMPRALEIFKTVNPKVNYWAYPVGSKVFSEWSFESTWKIFFEYWKYLVFHYFRFLYPIPV